MYSYPRVFDDFLIGPKTRMGLLLCILNIILYYTICTYIINSTICKSLQNLFLLNSIFLNNNLLENHGNLI